MHKQESEIDGEAVMSEVAVSMLQSPNVRAALRLRRVIEAPHTLLAHSRSLPLLLNLLFQVCNPVILTSNSSAWQWEVLLLRSILIEQIVKVKSICANNGSDQGTRLEGSEGSGDELKGELPWGPCVLDDTPTSVGARGLFLLAYQAGVPTSTQFQSR